MQQKDSDFMYIEIHFTESGKTLNCGMRNCLQYMQQNK